MKTGQIVASSYTQKKVQNFLQVKAEILSTFRLSELQYNALIFEYGCEFVGVENEIFLQDESLGFWAWWKYVWLIDDSAILKSDFKNSGKLYFEMKRAMIQDDEYKKLYKIQINYAKSI